MLRCLAWLPRAGADFHVPVRQGVAKLEFKLM